MPALYNGTHPDGKQRWAEVISSPPHRIAIDTETESLVDRSLIGLGIGISGDEAFYFTPDCPQFEEAIRLVQDDNIHKIYHNIPYDLFVLRQWEPSLENVDDTSMMGKLVNPGKITNFPTGTLEEASFSVGRQTGNIKEIMDTYNAKGRMSRVPLEVTAQKCCTDVQATWLLYDRIKPHIDWEYYKVDRAMIKFMDHISQVGILIDQDRRQELDDYYTQEIAYYQSMCQDQYGFNPNSPQQVGMILANRGNFLPLSRETGALVTDKKALSKISDPMAQMILLARGVRKLYSTYIKPLEGAERAYTILAMDVATGRFNSSGQKQKYHLNLQNVSKLADANRPLKIRSMFIPDSGIFTHADASQLELRVLAFLSQDKVMLHTFASGGDIHNVTMRAMGLPRVLAKNVNFGMVYGGDPVTLAEYIGSTDYVRMAAYRDQWFATYPGAAAWIKETMQKGWDTGVTHTYFGRPMRVPLDQGEGHARNCSVNYPIQGTAGDIFKRYMIALGPMFFPAGRLNIHDALLIDGHWTMPYDIADATPIHAPLEVEYLERWG